MGLLDAFKNTNIFGARRPTYLEGIATPEQLKQAEQQSLVQGLLGTAVGYLAQPKNQGYGSAIPYLAKGYLQGMQSAQAPYQGLERDVLMKSKFQDIQREQDIAKQQRQMTEQLLNDPRVQGNPLYESMAVNAPADLFKELEKVTVIREGGKAIKGSTGEVIAESPKAPKAPEDKRSQLERMIDIYNTMDDTDPRKKMYGDYIAKETAKKEGKEKSAPVPSIPTANRTDLVKSSLGKVNTVFSDDYDDLIDNEKNINDFTQRVEIYQKQQADSGRSLTTDAATLELLEIMKDNGEIISEEGTIYGTNWIYKPKTSVPKLKTKQEKKPLSEFN